MIAEAMEAREARRLLRRLIEAHREEIGAAMARARSVGRREDAGVELTELRNAMPRYIAELTNVLLNGPESLDHRAGSAWSTVAREHGITRVRIGFDISQLVHEFIVLRQTIKEIGRKSDPAFSEAEGLLPEILEPAIAVAVQAYVEARDCEARRAEAAHIGFLTHELRNPLAVARLAAAHIRRAFPDQQVPALDRLDRALTSLDGLIESVLLTEKLEAGAVQAEPTEVTYGQLMGPVEALRAQAEAKRLHFRTEYQAEQVVKVDPKLMQSAIDNLAENAVKYTDAGGVEVAMAVDGPELAVDVRDTCGGLSSEELETVFEPFKRGDTYKTGTGLGLAIARRAIEAQGGRIEAESPGDGGCHFSIRLPVPVADTHNRG